MKTNASLSKLTPDATLAQIVSVDRQAGQLLASIGLEPTNHKDETLRSACRQRQWSEIEVLQWIKKNRSAKNNDGEQELASKEPDFGDRLSQWCAYIEETFYTANIDLLHEISEAFPRVHQIHGNQYTQLKDMKWYFEQFEEALRMYFKFLRKKFFPLAETLKNQNREVLYGTTRQLERCIELINEDQQRLQRLMNTIQAKSRQFENAPGTCSSLRILNQNFKMLFSGLNKQFNMEKEIILPLVQRKLGGI